MLTCIDPGCQINSLAIFSLLCFISSISEKKIVILPVNFYESMEAGKIELALEMWNQKNLIWNEEPIISGIPCILELESNSDYYDYYVIAVYNSLKNELLIIDTFKENTERILEKTFFPIFNEITKKDTTIRFIVADSTQEFYDYGLILCWMFYLYLFDKPIQIPKDFIQEEFRSTSTALIQKIRSSITKSN